MDTLPPRHAPSPLPLSQPCPPPPPLPPKVLAEAPVSALISAIGGATLYPLVGFQRSLSKFGHFLTALCLEGLSAGAIGLLLGAASPSSDVALALFPPITVLTIIFNGLNIAEVGCAPRARVGRTPL